MLNIDAELEYELGSWVRVVIMARSWVGVRVRILFCIAVLHNFSQFNAFRIAHMWNGHSIKIRVRVSR